MGKVSGWQGLSLVVIEGCQAPTLVRTGGAGYKFEGWFPRYSSPRALASFAAILGQELWESQAKNAIGLWFTVDREQ